ncbi:MAG: hypothetical protein EOM25_12365 [Deltaproteobacteria bacterium]|nr:hypothetical protein [Deltaproteobacteria bacterium]
MSNFKLAFGSQNGKTGPIPVSMSGRDTCPNACPLKEKGCYALYGRMAWNWNSLSEGRRGGDFASLLADIRRMPAGQLWRHNSAGDLPTIDNVHIDAEALTALVKAQQGRRGFTYTHYDPRIPENAEAIRQANAGGFTINLSADTLAEADEFADLGIAPVVTTLPIEAPKSLRTPAGRKVVTCPATYREKVTCSNCGICQQAKGRAIVGFPAHGSGKRATQAVFES